MTTISQAASIMGIVGGQSGTGKSKRRTYAQCVAGARKAAITRRTPMPQKFWNQVLRLGPDECWVWQGRRSPKGYGEFWNERKSKRAHRVAWELERGRIPGKLMVCHHCDNKPCCNPSHLFLGTASDNQTDAYEKGLRPDIRGDKAPKAIVTNEQAREIRERFIPKIVTGPMLAKEYGLSKQATYDIIYGRHFKNVL